MNHLTKGALTMVLAGSVTFSIANAWLGGQPAKQLFEKVNAIAHSELQKRTNFLNNQADQTVNVQTPKPKIQNLKTTPSHKTEVVQAVIKEESNTNKPITSVKQTIKTSPNRVTTPPAIKVTSSGAASRQQTVHATSSGTHVSKTGTTSKSTASTTTTHSTQSPASPNAHAASASSKALTHNPPGRTTTSSTTTNHGQQVSQLENEKNATNGGNKANNGKKL